MCGWCVDGGLDSYQKLSHRYSLHGRVEDCYVLGHVMLCHAVSCSVIPCQARSCRVVHGHAVSCSVMSCHAPLCRDESCVVSKGHDALTRSSSASSCFIHWIHLKVKLSIWPKISKSECILSSMVSRLWKVKRMCRWNEGIITKGPDKALMS